MDKVVKIELIVQIKEDGEVVAMAIPHPIGKPSVASSTKSKTNNPNPVSTTPVKTQPKTSTKSSTKSKKSSFRKKGETKRQFLLRRIKELMEENASLRDYLTENEVDVNNLENLSDKQLARAMALSLEFTKFTKQPQKTETENEEDWVA